VGALLGTITNATNRTAVFVQVAGRPWVVAELTSPEWIANLMPAYNTSGLAQIFVTAFDSDGRTARAEFWVNVSNSGSPVPDLDIRIHGPMSGAVVEGSFVVSGATLNGTDPVWTRISLNGSNEAESVLDRDWSVTLSTGGAAQGLHFLWVEAIDAEGRVAFAGLPIVINYTAAGPQVSILFPTNGTQVERSFVLVGACSNCSASQRILVFVEGTRVAEFDARALWQVNVSGVGSEPTEVRVELHEGSLVVSSAVVSVQPKPEANVVQPAEFPILLLAVFVLAAASVAIVAMSQRRPRDVLEPLDAPAREEPEKGVRPRRPQPPQRR
jgi:hypothetical protein